MACVYDSTLADDCVTPLAGFSLSSTGSAPLLSNCAAGLPYDESGNPCPGAASSSLLAQVNAAQTGTPSPNPVASSAGTSSGGTSIGTSVLNFFSSVAPAAIKAATGPSATTGLILQVNPATGLQQYYNPTTGQYVAGAVNTGGLSGLLSGGSGFFLIIAALIVAFFAFGGRKKLAAA